MDKVWYVLLGFLLLTAFSYSVIAVCSLIFSRLTKKKIALKEILKKSSIVVVSWLFLTTLSLAFVSANVIFFAVFASALLFGAYYYLGLKMFKFNLMESAWYAILLTFITNPSWYFLF